MQIPVRVKSNITNRVIEKSVLARDLIDIFGEDQLIEEVTKCDCEPIGETMVVECNCYEEWMDCEVLIGDEIK